jgi:hypothetical protein
MWYTVLIERYKEGWFDRHVRFSAALSIVLFLFSVFVVQPAAVQYATERASNAVTDIILSNIPVYNVDEFFVYGMFLLVAVVAGLLLAHPKRIPFVLHALTLFVLIRAAFVSMTHIGPPYSVQITSDFGEVITKIFFGADLFFSGHTGAPFLLALIFWQKPRLRYLFLAWSVFFGSIVLLGHFHYTIDVAAAFFITYGIYHLSLWLFPKEHTLFCSE